MHDVFGTKYGEQIRLGGTIESRDKESTRCGIEKLRGREEHGIDVVNVFEDFKDANDGEFGFGMVRVVVVVVVVVLCQLFKRCTSSIVNDKTGMFRMCLGAVDERFRGINGHHVASQARERFGEEATTASDIQCSHSF